MKLVTGVFAVILVRIALIGLYCSCSVFLELLFPQAKLRLRGILINCGHGLIYTFIAVGFADPLSHRLITGSQSVAGLGTPLAARFSDHGSFGIALLLSFLSFAAYDFFYYWFHRLQHWSRWLWAEHELHHSEEQMNVTTGVRHHHLEIVLFPLFITIPFSVLFGLPKVSWALATFTTQAFVFFIHANARIGFGGFNRILVNPQVHRIHHSRLSQHYDKNFAAFFSFWDVIFGTYYHPLPEEYPAVGLASGRVVNSVWEAAIMPFQAWRRMI